MPLGRINTSLEGLTPLGRISASLEVLTPPRVSFRLARGTQTPERVSASLEAALDPRYRTGSPAGALNALARHERPGQRRIPTTSTL
jgi:hypothetical protein